MIIRRYVVNDMREALIRAKYELGSEAIIIDQKTVRPGKWFNPFREKKLEVTVAIEDDILEKEKIEKERLEKEIFNRTILEMQGGKKEDHIPFDKLESVKKHPVFGGDTKVLRKWKDYCCRSCISEDSLGYEQVKKFINETYIGNAFVKEMKLGRINVLVGPAGVGKTTTIAKIVSREFLQNDKKVGLITIDTYRIAAVEQLKKYAKILGINCETVNEPSEMKKKLYKLRKCDIILIDTLGASPKNEDRIEDIKQYLDEIEEEKNTYLSISMSADVDTNNLIMETYKALDYNSLILTKFDEVRNFNNFWNIIENNVLPVQYFCFGQTVPEDIAEASLDNVLSYLWRELRND
jgi:flagellar biosynthesis protein FlhF